MSDGSVTSAHIVENVSSNLRRKTITRYELRPIHCVSHFQTGKHHLSVWPDESRARKSLNNAILVACAAPMHSPWQRSRKNVAHRNLARRALLAIHQFVGHSPTPKSDNYRQMLETGFEPG